jgi:protein MpaA
LKRFALITAVLAVTATGCLWRHPGEPAKKAPKPPAAATSQARPESIPSAEVAEIQKICGGVRAFVEKVKWKIEPCRGIRWKVGGHSVLGRPLLYAEFGNPTATNTTLILTMVHGDEVTPLYTGIQLAHWLDEHPDALRHARVILAPLVNPDGFFHRPQHRTNAHRVDVNRNLPTQDWDARALVAWKRQYRSNPRRFPGSSSGSEPETQFQIDLIQRYRPQKILSVHSPLNMMDYDGPTRLSLDKFPNEYVRECLKLRKQLKAVHSGFFPGSLGNYAGNEMGIPTLTLELPTASAKMAEKYWSRFREGIRTMIEFKMPEYVAQGPASGPIQP